MKRTGLLTNTMLRVKQPPAATGKSTAQWEFNDRRGIALVSGVWVFRSMLAGANSNFAMALSWNPQRRGLTNADELLSRQDNICVWTAEEQIVTTGAAFSFLTQQVNLHKFPIWESVTLQHVLGVTPAFAGILLYYYPVEFTEEEWAQIVNKMHWRTENEPELP